MKLQTKKEEFLANAENKQRFINLLSNKLRGLALNVYHAAGDADLLIVKTAIECADEKETIVVADDTDILVLLLYHVQDTKYNVWFQPSTKRNSRKPKRSWSITAFRSRLGIDICNYILFVHAVSGCDTSRVFGIGKGKALKKLKKDQYFVDQAKVFMDPSSN